MKRREFIAGAGSAVAWAAAGSAQEDKIAKIGILALGHPDPAPLLKSLREGLRELGYEEGKNIQLEFRSAQGRPDKLSALAAELVALKVDLIVAFQTPAATAAKQVTHDVPIVMDTVGDPVGTGLVASLARPGGNITGVTGATAELGAKNLELVREVLPAVRRVAVLANAPDPFSKPFLEHIQSAATTLKIEIKPIKVAHGVDELDADFAEIANWQAQAVVVQPSLPEKQIAELALKYKVPAFAPTAGFPALGGLMSYSADLDALYRKGARFIDNILKGRKPADLPVELATKFLLVVNLKTAKALGVSVPGTMLTRADEVIE
jgi:putative ABC transport system substrate-binding protein